jgi:hypothetical protein
MADGLYIPTFVADSNFKPAIIQPRIFFYNGKKSITPGFKFGGWTDNTGLSSFNSNYTQFPYFDHYSGATDPTPDSESLLFYNEDTAYGTIPNETLYSKYWEKYISLLYNPRTRYIECEAVISFTYYVNLELNDIISYRNKKYHLRAINDYNLKTGECKLQLLGPILGDSLYP